jgi:multidrug efflux pump subunit AcrA (membrane-fusion protein)
MHPTVQSGEPGICPVCTMNLVRKDHSDKEVEFTQDIANLAKSSNESVAALVKTIKAEQKKFGMAIQAQGVVTYDSKNLYAITSRVGGRLEKVYLKYAFQKVTRGQKIADIYSPELTTAQRELLFLLELDSQNSGLIALAKERLSLLGISSMQLKELIKRREIKNTFTVYSSIDGYIITDQEQTPAAMFTPGGFVLSAGEMDVMNSSGLTPTDNSEKISPRPFVTEGNYITPGETLFMIVNANALRVELNLPALHGATLKNGDAVELNMGDGNRQTATIDFIQPFFNEAEEFVKVRAYISDTDNLQIGQFMNAVIKLDTVEGLWVPREAVLDLGLEKVMFMKESGIFKPVKITTGMQTAGWIEIRHGLSSSDEIASNAHFLVDSEGFVKTQR